MGKIKTSIGGQALIEGIMMRGPKKTCMAVRDTNKEIILEESETKGSNRPKILKLPFIRGIFNMVDSLSCGYKALMRSAEISGLDAEEEEKKKKRGKRWYDKLVDSLLMPLATVIAVALCLVLFIWLPMQLWKWLGLLVPSIADNYFLRACFEGVLRIIVFVLYVWATSLMKDIRRTYMYHGAEHKTIFCYEAGLPLTVENVRKQGRFHPRCGTSFMILVLIVSIIVAMFIRIDTIWLRMIVKLCTLPIIVGIGYELIKLAGRSDNIVTRIISAPGMALQHLTVFEPEDEMIECAIKAMEAVIPDDGSDQIK
ncbi:MAG: DUF1385 domain-containing protein [Clostridia bacterium]|nr:DUF1385 domain-containing protein [Clostridia bacterium]